jgi:putative DNA primase/helicase
MTDKRKGNGTGAAGTAQQMVDAAMQEGDINAEVEKLAALPPSVYETKRSDTAKRLGMRASVLDKLVTKKRAQSQDGQGRRVEINNAEPWGEAVDGAALLNDMSSAIRAHIVVTQEQADAVALYSVYTHAYEVFKVAPRLGIRAPTRECGKSELLLRVQRFVSRPLASENLTGPVLFRLIELKHPSLFIDEFDNLLSESKSELLGLLNSGYARDGKTHRLVGDKQYEIREFSTFCPLIYGMIGKPRDSFNSAASPSR